MDKGLKRVDSPEDLGLDSGAVLEFMKKAGRLDIHALAIVKDGKVYAAAKKPYGVDSPHTLFSLSKSFCSMAAGMAVKEGLLKYEDSVAEVLADNLEEGFDPKLKEVTLHHLLSMSSGLDEKSDHEIREGQDWARAALKYKVVFEPGTHFHYNTMGTYLAGRMVAKRTGMSLRDYLMPRLFEPLGIEKPQWDCCPLGYNTGGFGLHLSVMDLAKAAQLLQNGGVWGGKRLLDKEYLKRATQKQVDNRNPEEKDPHPDWSQGYGYQFWMTRGGRYRGDGMFGQVMMQDIKKGISVCCTAGTNLMGDELDALYELLNTLDSPGKAPDKAAAKLKTFEKRWAVKAPKDGGEPLFGEGTYMAQDGKTLRLETPDEGHLRLLFKAPDWPNTLKLAFARIKPHLGEFPTWPQGERAQAYQGRFGVKDSVLTAQLVMPEAPYRLEARITKTEAGIHLEMEAIGFDEGTFDLKRVDHI